MCKYDKTLKLKYLPVLTDGSAYSDKLFPSYIALTSEQSYGRYDWIGSDIQVAMSAKFLMSSQYSISIHRHAEGVGAVWLRWL